MIAYLSVDRARVDDVLEGRLTFLLRRVGRVRLPVVGQTINLCVPVKHPKLGEGVHQFASAQVVYRARAFLRPEGLARVLPGHAIGAAGERLSRQFLAAERGASLAQEHLAKIAAAEGFTAWADLYAFHAAQQSADKPRPPLIREVIGWSDARKLKGAR